jgi:hypothetical protein
MLNIIKKNGVRQAVRSNHREKYTPCAWLRTCQYECGWCPVEGHEDANKEMTETEAINFFNQVFCKSDNNSK